MENKEYIAMIKDDINGEYDAIEQYQYHIDCIDDDNIKKVLTSIMEEEMTHLGELYTLIDYLDPSFVDQIYSGMSEADELLTEKCIEMAYNKNKLTESYDAKQVAETIHAQLGGHKFDTMIGAKYQSYDDNGNYSFRFNAKAINRSNYCKIEYNYSNDDYTMIFGRISGSDYKVLDTIEGLYAEDLERVFSETTGLSTRL